MNANERRVLAARILRTGMARHTSPSELAAPSKDDLRAMLAEAARNTAALPTEGDARP